MMRISFSNRCIFSLVAIFISFQSFSAQGAPSLPKGRNSVAERQKSIFSGNPSAVKGGLLAYEFYEPTSINPISYKEAGATEILEKWVFESLAESDAVTGEQIPRLAKSWEISKDRKRYTFHLDERAKWYDGAPVTAEDVNFSFDVFNMNGANSPFRKQKLRDFERIEIEGNHKITFVAKEALFSNFEFVASTLILPKHLYYQTDPKKLGKNKYTRAPQGSGPYFVEKWEKGRYLTLRKNSSYWGSVLPQNTYAYNFDKIMIKYIRDPQMAFEMLKKGDLDYMPVRVGSTQIWKQTQTAPQFVKGAVRAIAVNNRIQQGYGFIGFNIRNDLFSDKRVRKALAMAVNREELIEKTLHGMAVVPRGPLYSLNNATGKFRPVVYNANAAAAELATLGWKDSDGDYVLDKNGRKFQFTILVPNARIEKELLFIQSYWKKIGVDAQIKILEYSTWQQLQSERRFDAIANGKNRTFHERNVDPKGEWHSASTAPGLSNHYGYMNPKVDALIEKGRVEMDFQKRKSLFTEVNDIVAEEYVMFQYSESKYTMFTLSSKIEPAMWEGNPWLPYSFGEKYWYRTQL
jgi:ABC-type transport system substrate-binding protein